MPHATPPTTVRTERLHLRAWDVADAPELRALIDANDAHLRPWIPFMRHEPRDLDGTRAVIESCIASFAAREHLRYAVRTRDDGRLVGEVMLIGRGPAGSMELGYWIDAGATRRGFAAEASRALLAIAFDTLGLEQVEIVCDVRNAPSVALAERLGGERARTDHVDEEGRTVDLGVWVVRPSAS